MPDLGFANFILAGQFGHLTFNIGLLNIGITKRSRLSTQCYHFNRMNGRMLTVMLVSHERFRSGVTNARKQSVHQKFINRFLKFFSRLPALDSIGLFLNQITPNLLLRSEAKRSSRFRGRSSRLGFGCRLRQYC